MEVLFQPFAINSCPPNPDPIYRGPAPGPSNPSFVVLTLVLDEPGRVGALAREGGTLIHTV